MKTTLSDFLRILANKIDRKELDNRTLRKITELYIEYLFRINKTSKKDFQKYLFMGWYIYSNLDSTHN
jgi:hypothetical protein